MTTVAPSYFSKLNSRVISNQIMTWGVMGLLVSILFARGTYREAIYIVALGFLLRGLNPKQLVLPQSLRWTLGVLGLLWVWGLLANHAEHWAFGNATLWCALLVTVFFQLPFRPFAFVSWPTLIGPVIVLSTLAHNAWNLSGCCAPQDINDGYKGLFSNIHYLAEYTVITTPLMAYYFITSQRGFRWVYLAALFGNLELLLAANSRPGYFAAIASILIVIPWVSSALRWRILSGSAFLVVVLYFGDVAHFATRMRDLAANSDERVLLWQGWKEIFTNSSLLQRWLGHGLGQFSQAFHEPAVRLGFVDFQSPHNFIFEILFSHGILGLTLVGVWIVFLYVVLLRQIMAASSSLRRVEGLTLLSALTGLGAHTFFTIPFFSRDFMIPFAFVMGLILLYLRDVKEVSRPRESVDVQPAFEGHLH